MFNLIVNNGSASKKYSLYKEERLLFTVHYEKLPDYYLKTEKEGDDEKESQIDHDIFKDAFSDFLMDLIKRKLIVSEDDIDKIGLRVVAPGIFFQDHHLIDRNFLEVLDDKKHLSPLHISPVQEEISGILDKLPDIKIYAISDSNFHKDKPNYANVYAYPKKITQDLELYRFGYHGLSVVSIINKIGDQTPSKLIVCHLGGGSSITAVKDGVSIDNTMGYSPLEGIPMATRIGNADPNSIFAVMEEKDFDTSEIQNFLYRECGFKGISDLSGDTRVILSEVQKGNKDAELALDFYAYEIKKVIGSYKAILGGLDTLVFTGTIGHRAADVRRRICDGLESEGIVIDQSKNKLTIKNEGKISSEDSQVDVLVFQTNEMAEINRILGEISR